MLLLKILRGQKHKLQIFLKPKLGSHTKTRLPHSLDQSKSQVSADSKDEETDFISLTFHNAKGYSSRDERSYHIHFCKLPVIIQAHILGIQKCDIRICNEEHM